MKTPTSPQKNALLAIAATLSISAIAATSSARADQIQQATPQQQQTQPPTTSPQQQQQQPQPAPFLACGNYLDTLTDRERLVAQAAYEISEKTPRKIRWNTVLTHGQSITRHTRTWNPANQRLCDQTSLFIACQRRIAPTGQCQQYKQSEGFSTITLCGGESLVIRDELVTCR